jgi:hypothetical protein
LAALKNEHRIRSLHQAGGPKSAKDLADAEQEVLRVAIEYAALLGIHRTAPKGLTDPANQRK